ncbi:MAG: PAS domain-containing protein [Proteobacteria bacterium]|nr:PAS domain-containing protein [Desulfobulbaceae bacterium]MBU4152597.1 PAS domain-containing protein [Pseudomonadota bacterium]
MPGERLRKVRTSTDLLLGIDKKGCHSFANPAAQRMLGYSMDELLGQESHTLWHHTNVDGTPNSIDTLCCP